MDSLWIDFVNTDARDHLGRGQDEDRLENAAWMRRFLEQWGLERISTRSPESRAALGDLRLLLQRFVTTLVDGLSLSSGDVEELNAYLGARPVRSRLDRKDDAFRVRLDATGRGVGVVQFAVAASFAEFLVDGDPTRLTA